MSIGEFVKEHRTVLTVASVAISCLSVGFYAGLRTGNVVDYEVRYYRDGMVAGMGPTPVEGRPRWGTTWYATGEVFVQIELEGTRMTGRSRVFNTDGHLISESLKADANGLSTVRTYFDEGQLFGEGLQRNGKSEGQFKYHDRSGALAGESNYVDGKLDGQTKKYYSNGAICTITEYSRGERVGAEQHFDEQGNPVTEEEWKRREADEARVRREKRKASPASRQTVP